MLELFSATAASFDMHDLNSPRLVSEYDIEEIADLEQRKTFDFDVFLGHHPQGGPVTAV